MAKKCGRPVRKFAEQQVFVALTHLLIEDAGTYAPILGQVTERQVWDGMNHELEHGCQDKSTNVTYDDPVETAKIALAHLREDKDYYKKLARMEKGACGR